MKRTFVICAVLLAALALAGHAGAVTAGQTYQLNLWGASAQFQLYNQTLATFLSNPPYNCAPVNHLDNGTLGITTGTNCDGATAGAGRDTIIIRASSKASYDGVLALQGKGKAEDIAAYPATVGQAGGTNFCDPNNFPAVVTPDYHYRIMYNTTAGDYACLRVDLALSDVYPPSFTQDTNPGTPISNGSGNPRKFSNNPITAASLSGFNSYNPMIVPFAFYAHNDIAYATCANTASALRAGEQCTSPGAAGNVTASSTDCPNGPLSSCTYNATAKAYQCAGGVNAGQSCQSTNDCPASYGSCTSATLNNLSKLEAILIFSKQANSWTDLGAGYYSPTNTISTCYRVAGSGTHATLDYAIMKAQGYPLSGSLPTSTIGATSPLFFNDGTGAEMKCVNLTSGAVGYADADQALSMQPLWGALGKSGSPTYANTVQLSFEGVVPSRRAIRNGEYDNFFSKEWVFQDPTSPTFTGAQGAFLTSLVTNAGATGLIDQLSTPTAMSATDRAGFWAAFGEKNGSVVNEEMWYMKDTDQLYPKAAVANDPQTP